MDNCTEESFNSDEKCNSLHVRKPVWKSPSLKIRTKTKRKQRKETIKIFTKCRLTKRVRKSIDETENNDERSSYDEIETLRSEDCSETNGHSSDLIQTLYEEFIVAESLRSQCAHPKESTFMHGKEITANFPEEMSRISRIAQGSTFQNEAESHRGKHAQLHETFIPVKEITAKFPDEFLHGQHAHVKESTFIPGKEMTVKFPEEVSHISRVAKGSAVQNEDSDFGNNDIFLDVQNIIEPENLEENLFREELPEPNFIEKLNETVSSTAKHGEKKSESLDVRENQDSAVIRKVPCCLSRSKVKSRSKIKSRFKGPEEKTLCETELPVYPFSGQKVSICSLSRINLQHHGFNAKITKKPLRAVSASVMKKIRSLPLCSLSGFNTHKLKPIDEQEEELI